MIVEDWGLVEYQVAVQRQLALVDEVASGAAAERIVLCSHPPVVTLGRATTPEDLDGWTGSTLETSRGGRATYHGPSQLVIYPILDLRIARTDLPPRDVHGYLRRLEAATVSFLRALDVDRAEARVTKVGELSLTGVWVGERKIASIGIAVRKWITYHGVAVNLTADPAAFRGIRPCGFAADVMTNCEAELGTSIDPIHCHELGGRIFGESFTARVAP